MAWWPDPSCPAAETFTEFAQVYAANFCNTNQTTDVVGSKYRLPDLISLAGTGYPAIPRIISSSVRAIAEFRQNVDAVIIPAETLGGDEGGAASGKGVQHNSPGGQKVWTSVLASSTENIAGWAMPLSLPPTGTSITSDRQAMPGFGGFPPGTILPLVGIGRAAQAQVDRLIRQQRIRSRQSPWRMVLIGRGRQRQATWFDLDLRLCGDWDDGIGSHLRCCSFLGETLNPRPADNGTRRQWPELRAEDDHCHIDAGGLLFAQAGKTVRTRG